MINKSNSCLRVVSYPKVQSSLNICKYFQQNAMNISIMNKSQYMSLHLMTKVKVISECLKKKQLSKSCMYICRAYQHILKSVAHIDVIFLSTKPMLSFLVTSSGWRSTQKNIENDGNFSIFNNHLNYSSRFKWKVCLCLIWWLYCVTDADSLNNLVQRLPDRHKWQVICLKMKDRILRVNTYNFTMKLHQKYLW